MGRTNSRVPTAQLRQAYKRFVYQLTVVGLAVAMREARRVAGRTAPETMQLRDARGRYSLKDLRKGRG